MPDNRNDMKTDEKNSLKNIIDVAAGRRKAQFVFRNAGIVDVFSHSVQKGSLAVEDGLIAGIGAYEGVTEIDLNGKFIVPGLIDGHVHIESSLSSPGQFAKSVLPRGTTTVIADPHEIANIRGAEGIQYMVEASRNLPLNVFFMLPSCVPATAFEHSGAVLGAEELERLMEGERIIGLGEVMDYPAVIEGDDDVLDKILSAKRRGKKIDGHGPMIEGKDLAAYAVSGIKTEHECSTPEEMRERMKAGMYILLREGSAARNLNDLLSEVTPENSRRCLFCTDDRQPGDILKEGHIDNHIRMAVRKGIDPVTAVKMATLNAAECYGLTGKGAIAPGYDADFLVVDNLADFNVLEVYSKGIKYAENGKPLFEAGPHDISRVSNTLNVKPFGIERFGLPLKSDMALVIRVQAGSLVTEAVKRKIHRDGEGYFRNHPDLDITKLAVIERHKATGNIGLALVENYKIRGGAIASTIAHDSHNIIVLGDNDADMYAAAGELIRAGGGITIVSEGKVLSTLELPIGGIMSDRDGDYISGKLLEMNRIAYERLSINPHVDPFMTLSFLALPVIPELKLTDMGLFDVGKFRFVDISLE